MVTDRAHRVRLWWLRRVALVALRLSLEDGTNLAKPALRPRLDERQVGGEAHAVDMPPRADVVERVQADIEALKEG